MKNIYFLSLIVFALSFTACMQTRSNAQTQSNTQAQSNTQTLSKSFLSLTENEKADFAAGKIDEITMKISGKKYPFDSEFKLRVISHLDSYAKRAGNNVKNRPFGEDLNFVLQYAAEIAPTINAVFDKNGVSRLSGLYIAMIETEFNNELVSPTRSSGAFMLTAAQAQKYGMTKKDLVDLSKSAEITARLLVENQKKFESNDMKEFLAILSHNRDPKKIDYDVRRQVMDDYRACSICGMTKLASKLDEQFQNEAVKYVPKFLAAAIIGENPQDFGLSTKPLSTLGAKTSQNAPTRDSDLNVTLDYWTKQKNKALEPRRSPVGVDLKDITITGELAPGKQKTTLEAMKAQAFAVPMDFFDLAERKLNKELVELPSATETYVLDVGAIATDKVFTKFNFTDGVNTPALNSNSQKGVNVPAADSDNQKKMKELADNYNLNLNNPNDRKQIRMRLMRMISPRAKPVLEELAQKYQAKFNRPLRVTSLIQPIDYLVDLNKVDASSFLVREDGGIPPHSSGLAFDFDIKNLTAEEQNFIADILTEMDKSGKIDGVRQTGPTAAFHVFVL